ncbi:UDP-4-amino-4,6-dideoxy-N-acetyl-beta-L-altrosamine transaminase [Persephonella sp.]
MGSFIPYGRQFIDEEDINAVVEVLRSDFITQGETINRFEKSLAEYFGARYAVVFNSGTSALHGAYFSLGLKKGDKFITTPLTFAATSNAGLFLGARPVFVDVEPDTGNIDVSKIEESVTPDVSMISVVHYAGHPVDMEKVYSIAKKYGLKVVEDACHAMGAMYRGEKIGSCRYSDATVFSFHPVKHITTGEGGAVLTNDRQVYEKLLIFRNHGITKNPEKFKYPPDGDWYYEMQFLGFNYRMTDFQAALGISQLKKLDRFVKRRREIARKYAEVFDGNPYFDLPVEKDYAFHSYHLFPVKLKEPYIGKKKEIFSGLRTEGIEVQVHYIPVYRHPYYREAGYSDTFCPVAEDFYRREISLPVYYSLTDNELFSVAEKVKKVFNRI